MAAEVEKKVVRYAGEAYEVAEDLGLLLLLRRRAKAGAEEGAVRRFFCRRRRCVLADRDDVTSAEDDERTTTTTTGEEAAAGKTLFLEVEVLLEEIFSFVGCARCLARCARTRKSWAAALPRGAIEEYALQKPPPQVEEETWCACGHDCGALRAKAVLFATARRASAHRRSVARARIAKAVDDRDPRVRACALRAAKELRVAVPFDRLSDALYDDWKARRNASRYKKWHDALKPAIEREDWKSYERLVHCYAAVHEAGQRAALDVCGAAFLSGSDDDDDDPMVGHPENDDDDDGGGASSSSRAGGGGEGAGLRRAEHDDEDAPTSEAATALAAAPSSEQQQRHQQGRQHPSQKRQTARRRAELVDFLASLTATYSQRRVAKDAVARWDAETSRAFVEAVVEHLFSSYRYRRRTNAQHQAIVDVATPAKGCGPAFAVAILRHLDGDDLQQRLAARHALQIVVDCHAHRVSFITHHLVPACVRVADGTDWSQILHHVYHFCVPSWTAVYASLKHAVFCASVAIAVGAALAAAVALGNVLVCGCKTTRPFLSSDTSSIVPEFVSFVNDVVAGSPKKTEASLPLAAAAAAASSSLATPCLAFLDLNWLNSCLGAADTTSLSSSSSSTTTTAQRQEPQQQQQHGGGVFGDDDHNADVFGGHTASLTNHGEKRPRDYSLFTGTPLPEGGKVPGQDDGFTWTEVALMVMYSLFLPFLLVLHLVWLVDDFLCELQFLHCSRPFRDACVSGLLASIGP